MSPATSPGGGLWSRLRGFVGRGGAVPRGAATLPGPGVTDLLERGRSAAPGLSALDAVMGEDWGIVDFDRAGRPPVSRPGIAAAHARDVARYPGGGSPGRDPQAVVKMIRKGGASDLRGLRAQMDYLSRHGEEILRRSERYMGAEIDAEQARSLEQAWRMPSQGHEGGADRTSHFIVSFPEGTDPRAAKQAGRDWAEDMFGSGAHGGDAFDYYTAFHTDRAHPHLHVVVHRRGLERGAWLKVSRRSDITYDRMRTRLAAVARARGIRLEATPRHVRGIHDRPVPDAAYRRARAAGRRPEAPAHTPETAIRAAAAVLHHARRVASEARAAEQADPDLARRLARVAERLERGHALGPKDWEGLARERPGETRHAERLAVLENFRQMDAMVAEMPDGVERVRRMREVAEIRAEAAPDMGPYRQDFAAYTRTDPSGRYEGLSGSDPERDAFTVIIQAQVRGIARRHGVDGPSAVERMSGGPPSEGLAAEYAAAELRERAAARAARGDPPETAAEARAGLEAMHAEIRRVHDRVRTRQSAFREENPWVEAGQRRTRGVVDDRVGDTKQFRREEEERLQREAEKWARKRSEDGHDEDRPEPRRRKPHRR